ncbi:hypothetical protein MUG84_08665 [Paenibacillus sp. KQZ6P-2]|uniref:Uncharacterized protein n=1 Tax=Paenibacillus mangrovi TaxID=2931978 RepID=A0A9X1WMS7_9BACL|nr:hypothetical protein [Paenibacillus mangrovi]MCJ8011813.1 hypothetical protein [Paenibacillus mangrovi]
MTMLRRFAAVLILTALLQIGFPSYSAESAGQTSGLTSSKVLELANADMRSFYFPDRTGDYFPERTPLHGAYRQDLLNRKIAESSNEFEIVYGSDHGGTVFHNNRTISRYSGYTRNGDPVSSEGFPWDAGWGGTPIQSFNMIQNPWENRRLGIDRTIFDDYKSYDPDLRRYLKDGTFEAAIIAGLNAKFAGKRYREFMYNNQNSQFADRIVYAKNASPTKGGRWVDYVHVLQPPTALAWGSGRIYIQGSSGQTTYLGIPIAPFSLLGNDLAAAFESLPSGATEGKEIRVGVRISSSFKQEVTTDFEWRITKADGTSLTADADKLAFAGHAVARTGSLTIPAEGERMLYASFVMPDSGVRITFSVNKDGNRPSEKLLENNVIDSHPSIRLITPIRLGYDVLSKKVAFPLAYGADIAATLTLPSGDWTGNATGRLNVTKHETDLFRNFQVSNNPPVNEAATTIVRNPIVHSTIMRTDFGDDPIGRHWLNPADPGIPRDRSGTVAYDGNVSRSYQYTHCDYDEEGNCVEKTVSGKVSAPFDSGTDTRIFEVYSYNGRKVLPKQTFKETIEQNSRSSKLKKLFWESEPYGFNVIRWMHHVGENGKEYGWTPVDGQYERTFKQQAQAEVGWETERSMDEQYAQARTAAKKGSNRKALYDKAVFATDRELQKFDYPIKSGYYFNPAGTYTVRVQTVTFKPTPADTQDHKDLVDAVINSFRYETDLMYINGQRAAVNVRNEPLPARGSGFERKPGVLTAKNRKGVDDLELLTVFDRSRDPSRYTKKVDEIRHSQVRDNNDTHKYWNMVMEGYGESSTSESSSHYQYRECVKDGQRMYKITETTDVAFVINRDDHNVYTHANMSNGNYYVRVWLEDIDLSNERHAYRKLGSIKGLTKLDEIRVTVQGSMYDDLNN